MVPAICPQCGGEVEVDASREKVFCQYCGTKFIVEEAVSQYNIQNTTIHNTINHAKKGAVESVLGFVEKQQDKKRQKEEEERRRVEEEKRREQEQKEKINNQLFNKQYRKRNLIIIAVVAVAFIIIGITGGNSSEPSHVGEARTPGGLTYMQGENYNEVYTDFVENGFINVKTEILDDLITGWLTKDGEVETVTVDGTEEFTANGWYPNDVEVVIVYHTFASDDEEEIVEAEKTVEEVIVNEVDSTVEAVEEVVDETVEVEVEEVLTLDNNSDFASLVQLKDNFDSSVGAFADKYRGRVVTFEGNIAHMMNHDNFSTRYDILIYAGDYSETSVSGPSFKFEDVNYDDLNLIGNDIPDSVVMGQNYYITAKVIKFDENSGLFYLKPVSMEIR